MEQLLVKMAAKLNSLDEASLSALWEKYAAQVNAFEPSKRWEESVLVLSFIQAVHWKNQLFNAQWAQRSKNSSSVDLSLSGTSEAFNGMIPGLLPEPEEERHAEVIEFRHRDETDESD